MNPFLNQGRLTTWKDEKGFGFIQPDDGGKQVFLHISALNKKNRRPQVGDIIVYERVTEADGKVRATKALIQGLTISPSSTKKRQKKASAKFILGLPVLPLVVLWAIFSPRSFDSPIQSIVKPTCSIKGNISVNTGNKIYHLPGMEDYQSTTIDSTKGERWFCTESEAIADGWRKAPI